MTCSQAVPEAFAKTLQFSRHCAQSVNWITRSKAGAHPSSAQQAGSVGPGLRRESALVAGFIQGGSAAPAGGKLAMTGIRGVIASKVKQSRWSGVQSVLSVRLAP